MSLSIGPSTVAPAVAVLVIALLSRALRGRPGRFTRVAARWAPLAVSLILLLSLWVIQSRLEPIPVLFGLLFGLVSPADEKPPLPSRRSLASLAPLALGVISMAVTAWVWAGGGFAPRYHDEAAYLLQAGIFAAGRWADPSPPLPEFFEQFHVLVVPTRAAKYPPGHAMVLAPGVGLELPEAVPLLLVAGTGALLFVLVRRLAGNLAAFVAWLVWTTAPGSLMQRSSYFSEVTTSFLWLAVWWALLRWKETGRTAWLGAVALGISWGAITRPLTMLLFAVPLAIVLLPRLLRRPAVLLRVAGLGILPLLILPLWSVQTTGNVAKSPLAAYTNAYLPFDVAGFGVRARSPERDLPPCMSKISPIFRRVHQEHTPAALPGILRNRVLAVLQEAFGGLRASLLVFALLGAARMPREGLLALASAALLVLGYLVYAHFDFWTIYYLEVQPVIAAAVGIGIVAAIRALSGVFSRWAGVILVAAIVYLGTHGVAEARSKREAARPRTERLRLALDSVSAADAVVFVRCAPEADPHEAIVVNGAGLDRARVWLVHDRGEGNVRLIALAGARLAYLYDELHGKITRLDSRRPSPPIAVGH